MSQAVVLYRMILPNHTCPFGVRATELLKSDGVDFEDRILRSRKETDAFQVEHDVSTTPQLFVDGERIGGTDEIERWLEDERVG